MVERPMGSSDENGRLVQEASNFLVGLLVGHPELKKWFASQKRMFEGVKTPLEVFERLGEIDLDDEQRKVIGYCVAICTPSLQKGRKQISPIGMLLRKSLEMQPRYPIPEGL